MADLREILRANFRWRSNPTPWFEEQIAYADYSRWWRHPDLLRQFGPALADLFPESEPTVVMAPASHGFLVGSLVASFLNIGLAEVRKGPDRASHDDAWLTRRTPPDYRDRHLELAVRTSVLHTGDRVLFVDDWAASGGQALTCQQLTADADAHWIGAAVIVDGLENASTRRDLKLRSLLHLRELG